MSVDKLKERHRISEEGKDSDAKCQKEWNL